jgi:1,4-dihydroxy-2-naphthoate octaprenyltransferase
MSRLRSYAQLVRLPALPTALADVCLGALATDALPGHLLPFFFLLLATACLYSAGMVWNDYFDQDQDRRERPTRPLPSGLVTPREAVRLGLGLLAAGVCFACLAGATHPAASGAAQSLSPILALMLVGAILLYDRWLKRMWLGPLGMGTCRFLNALLAVSVSGALTWPGLHLALIVGLYIVGVTWFARTEARRSNPFALGGAAVVMLLSLILALPLPLYGEWGHSSPLFPYLLVALGFIVGIPVYQAIVKPVPERVQAGVKRALFGLILFDAVLASAFAGSMGLMILLLLMPALYLNRKRWLYAT